MTPLRLTIVQTHPVQYEAPWFRHITQRCPEIDLTVIYAARPTPAQQGTGFGRAFEWDTNLVDGYRWRVVRESRPGDEFAAGRFRGLDVKEVGEAVIASKPDVVLVPGWHSITMVRAVRAARRAGVPVLYRGDTNNLTAPAGWRRLAWHAKTRVLLGRFSAYLSVGSRSREYLLSHGVPPTGIFASPHAVDNDCFAAGAAPHLTDAGRDGARRHCGARADDFLVLFAGKLEEKKRPLDAVRAVARLGSSAVLAIAGSGRLEPEVRAEAARSGVRVAPLGFVNQHQLGAVYAAADCLVLPSAHDETWGLVVNEAMATGLPAVVTDQVGCAPDLVVPGETGEISRAEDPEDLARALDRVRVGGGRAAMAHACRSRVARHSFAAATTGLLAACQSVQGVDRQPTRVIACCGGMVMVSGLERMTFEVLGVVRKRGGAVHCILNGWENHRIVELVERIGASWSTGFYWYPFTTRPRTLLQTLQLLWDSIRTSSGLAREAARFGPTHVLTPEYSAVLRNAPTLALLKVFGVKVVFRIANAPERGRIHEVLWRHVLPPFVTRFVPNSRFSYSRLQETGVPEQKITLIRNALSRRPATDTDEDVVRLAASRPTILAVGQIAPFKGTHLLIEAILQLLADGFDVQAIIVGALPHWPPEFVEYTARLREQAAAGRAADRVHFVGIRENVLEIMKASYVLAAPILQEETFGNVLLEARSVGLPVVTFARGGLTELVAHRRTGYLCPSADLPGLLEGLRFYLSRPEERAAASANSLDVSSEPGNDCTSGEFERRWWAMFAPAGHP